MMVEIAWPKRLCLPLEFTLRAGGLAGIVLGLSADGLGIGHGTLGLSQKIVIFVGLLALLGSFVFRLRHPLLAYWYSLILTTASFPIWKFWLATLSAPTLLRTTTPFPLRTWALVGSHWMLVLFSILFLLTALYAARSALRQLEGRKQLLRSHLFLIVQFALLATGLEFLGALHAPSWPARELRPVTLTPFWAKTAGGGFNSWGVRDAERSLEKPPGERRFVFVGDSFLEGAFCQNSLSGYTSNELAQRGNTHVACVNLGISATGPRHYLYRIQDFALRLSPDAILLFLYSGNDFVEIPSSDRSMMIIEERPLPSLLGNLLPRFTWLLVNRLKLSEYGVGLQGNPRPDEFEYLLKISQMPYAEGIPLLIDYMHHHYFPTLQRNRIQAVLHEVGPSLWSQLQPRQTDPAHLMAWYVKMAISRGLHSDPSTELPSEPDRLKVRATASYVEEIARILQDRDIPLVVFLIPLAENVDPESREFSKTLPNAHVAQKEAHALQLIRRALLDSLRKRGIAVVDLAEVLDGIPGAYRKLDGHWTEKGHQRVAEAVTQTLLDDNASFLLR